MYVCVCVCVCSCALALGFEKMQKGPLIIEEQGVNPLGRWVRHYIIMTSSHIPPTQLNTDKHMQAMMGFAGGPPDAPPAPWLWAWAGREHMKRYGLKSS